MKKVAILQSNYIPWKGYFDLIKMVDEFILFDDAQYTHSDWRNRNQIKTSQGKLWLTIPVFHDGGQPKSIRETKVASQTWRNKHWKTISQSYGKSSYFESVSSIIKGLYLESQDDTLSDINFSFIKAICDYLEIDTGITWSHDYDLVSGKTERLVSLCQQAKATHYISGPAARAYIDEALFTQAGIRLSYIDYSDYPVYQQLHGDFDHHVSIIDLLFNEGPNAPRFMKSFR